MEILGEGLGLHHDDLYKRFKLMQDVDAILAETSALAAQHGLDLETVRDVLLKEFGG
jgi:hypothetical protein